MSEPEPNEHQLPREFLQRLSRIIPAELLDGVIASFAVDKPTTFRLNTLSDSRDCILEELRRLSVPLAPIDWVTDKDGAAIAFQTPREHREQLTHSSTIDAGKIYVQNLSSMLAPIVLDPQPGETILDLAAAPGGKTTQIAQMMNNQGVLSAVEAVRNRMFKLQANLQRCQVKIAKTYLTDGRSVGRKTPERFDRVLLDAPCSSEARFHLSKPVSWANWSPRKIRESARKQFGLLKAAIHATKVGGRIIYCTCSFSPEENERIIHKALNKFGSAVEVVPIELPINNWIEGLTEFDSKPFDEQVSRCRRIIPNELMDAFFIASIRKLKSSST
jgi:NOL1/NOP2/sun family putative RNA methylase